MRELEAEIALLRTADATRAEEARQLEAENERLREKRRTSAALVPNGFRRVSLPSVRRVSLPSSFTKLRTVFS